MERHRFSGTEHLESNIWHWLCIRAYRVDSSPVPHWGVVAHLAVGGWRRLPTAVFLFPRCHLENGAVVHEIAMDYAPRTIRSLLTHITVFSHQAFRSVYDSA